MGKRSCNETRIRVFKLGETNQILGKSAPLSRTALHIAWPRWEAALGTLRTESKEKNRREKARRGEQIREVRETGACIVRAESRHSRVRVNDLFSTLNDQAWSRTHNCANDDPISSRSPSKENKKDPQVDGEGRGREETDKRVKRAE